MPDDLQAAMLRELVAIRRLLEARQEPRSDQHVALLQAIAAAAGSAAFTSAEVIAHAQVAGELREALMASCGLSARKLGKLLRKCEGVDAGGVVIERCGSDSAGVVWVCRVSERKHSLRIA